MKDVTKKIVLIFPKAWDSSKLVGRIPFSLLYLARNLYDYDVKIYDERLDDFNIGAVIKESKTALCVGLSVFTGYQIKSALRLSETLKKHSPNIPIIWGGNHPTLEPEQTLKNENIDYVVIGQGEQTFRELVSYLEKRTTDINTIEGLGYKNGNEIKINNKRNFINPVLFPEIDYSLIDCSKYFYGTEYANKVTGLFASHGCPHNCSFCSVYKVFNRKWYPKKVEAIIREIKYLKENFGLNGITFDDDNFFVNKKFTIEFLTAMIQNNLNVKWDCSAHASSFLKMADDDFMMLLKSSGCSRIYIGAETGNSKILEETIGKHSTVEDNYKFVELLSKWGITPLLSTMVGFPVGDGKDYLDTVNMISKCQQIDKNLKIRIFYYTPYPGTVLYNVATAKGFKPPETLEGWSNHTLRKFNSPWVDKEAKRFIRNFVCFYFLYHIKPTSLKGNPIKLIAKTILYLITDVRFKTNFFKYQYDAEAFYFVLKILDKLKIIDLSVELWGDYDLK